MRLKRILFLLSFHYNMCLLILLNILCVLLIIVTNAFGQATINSSSGASGNRTVSSNISKNPTISAYPEEKNTQKTSSKKIFKQTAEPRTITVGSSGADFTSIQAAVDEANEGDTVYIYNGTYNESDIDVSTSNIAINGESKTSVIIHGDTTYTAFVLINVQNVKISDLTVENHFQGLWIESGNSNELNNVISKSNKNYALIIKNSNYNAIKNSEFTNSVLGSGIYLFENSNNNILDNVICNDNRANGIFLLNAPQNTIIHSYITSNQWNGISNDTSINCTFDDIIADKNKNEGFLMVNCTGNTIKNSEFSNTIDFGGIEIYDSNSNLIDNVNSHDNNNNGIYIENSDSNTIQNSNLSSNHNFHGLTLLSSSYNQIDYVTAENNQLSGILLNNSYDNTIKNSEITNSINNPGIYLYSSYHYCPVKVL